MSFLIPLPNTDKIFVDDEGYLHGFWPSRKVQRRMLSYIDSFNQVIKINVPCFLRDNIKDPIQQEVNYHIGLRRMKLKELSDEQLLEKLESAKKVAKCYSNTTDGSYEAAYDNADGYVIEEELKNRGVFFDGLR